LYLLFTVGYNVCSEDRLGLFSLQGKFVRLKEKGVSVLKALDEEIH
jgi:hypothetical protein